jgi:hypothetical protein
MHVRAKQGLIASVVAVLTIVIFVFDIVTPRGLTNQVLYVVPLLISQWQASAASSRLSVYS